ncbi:MAG: efflux RND transporter permease subunit [Bacteroidetes bacterium]|nr:efflux RND transporter permease subunit [Bacteroidota bacterium]
MIKNIIGFALKNRIFVFFLTAILLVAGIYCYIKTPIVAFPDFTNTQIRIITLWPGRSAQEVERFVTIPIEITMNSVQRKTNLRSQSMFGLSVVSLVFEDDVEDMYARQQITGLLNDIDLPEGAEVQLTPPTGPIDEIYRYTLYSPNKTPAELRTLQDWVIDRNLRTVPGVADVVAFGGPVKTFEVSVNPNLLAKYGLTALDVYSAVNKSNINVGGDVIEKAAQAFVVRGIGLLNNIHEIENITVQNVNGTPILVKSVADVKESNRPRLGQVQRGNDEDVVEGIVLMRKNIDPGPVLSALSDKVKELNEKILPAGVEMKTFYNRQNLIDFCLHTVLHNVTEGMILVIILVFVFMLDMRSTIILSITVPLSLLFAFMMLYIKGMFANLISIGAIDFGILIDGPVVIIEAVFVALAQRAREMGMERFNKSAKLGLISGTTFGMARSIFFSKLILVTALIPVFAFEKVEGKIFTPLAYMLGFALLGSVILTFTLMPAMAGQFLRKNVKERHNVFLEGMLRYYEKFYDWLMRNKRLALSIAAVILISSFIAAKFLGTEFLPHLDEGAMWVEGEAPMSISLKESNDLASNMRKDLLSFSEVKEVASQVGRPDDGTDPKGFYNIECLVDLRPQEDWTTKTKSKEELINKMQEKLEAKYTGVVWKFSQPIIDNVNEAVAGLNVDQAVKIFGDNIDSLTNIAWKVYDVVSKVPGMEDVAPIKNSGQPELRILLNQEKMALYGVSTADANSVIEMAIGGKAASQLYENEKKFDIRIRYQERFRKSETEIEDLMVPTSSGTNIPLQEIADIKLRSGPAFIYRDNNRRFTAVQFAVRGRDLGGTVAEAQEKLGKLSLPKGYSLQFSGEYESEIRAMKKLSIVVPISLVIIFIILFIAFRNGRDVTIILLNVPFALVGGIFGLLLTGTNFNISAGIGFVALFGVCIQNGVILVSVFRQNLSARMPLHEAIKKGALSRVRPVVMTALLAIFGLLPTAMSTGIGSQTQKPLAIVIVGGMITAMALVLFILPVIYQLSYRRKLSKEG